MFWVLILRLFCPIFLLQGLLNQARGIVGQRKQTMAQTVGPVGPMVPTTVSCAPITSTAPANNSIIQGPAFNKVFVQRDYSEGTAVKFHTRLPSELDGLVCAEKSNKQYK